MPYAKDRNGLVGFISVSSKISLGPGHGGMAAAASGIDTSHSHHHLHHYSHQVPLPQLKWTLVAWGTAVKNESKLATLILRLFSHMAKIFPSRDGNGTIISSASGHI